MKYANPKMNDRPVPIPNLFDSPPDENSDPWYGAVRDQKERIHIKNHINSIWDKYYQLDLHDKNFITDFPKKDQFWQRYWELDVANFLLNSGFELSSEDAGVDFICKGTSIAQEFYVECVVSSRGVLNSPDYPVEIFPPGKGMFSVSNLAERERIELLRLTTSIDCKVKKYHEDIKKGYIKKSMPYILALSPALLFPDFISDEDDMPAVVKAVYPVGNICFHINVPTGTTEKSGRAWRGSIIKKSDTPPIRTDIFFPIPENEKYKPLTGILYSGADFRVISSPRIEKNGHSFIFVHNLATEKPIDLAFLGSNMDFWCEKKSDDYVIKNNTN